MKVIKSCSVSKEQHAFINSEKKFPAFVGGFGSGKTEALLLRLLKQKISSPGTNCAYYLPTYQLISDIAYPRIIEKLQLLGIHYDLNKRYNVFKLQGFSNIIMRSLDKPERIIGYEVAESFVDELDTLPIKKAAYCWQQIIARNRQKKTSGHNTVSVATTPEGFRFVYETWKKNPASDDYELTRGSTYSNARNLPSDYIKNLEEALPTNRLSAYLEGHFVNLTSGLIYTEFDRNKHCVPTPSSSNILHIGMDFNVGKMAAVVHVVMDNKAYAIAEIVGIQDTPSMIERIKSTYAGNKIFIYPDASGKSRKTVDASISDIQLLKRAGFKVVAPKANPLVRDRILRFNVALKNDKYFISENCPELLLSLEQHTYRPDGTPEKESGLDHIVDAAGYFVHKNFPIINNKIKRVRIGF